MNKTIEFNLICHKENNEYFQILSNQIRNLRTKNMNCTKANTRLQEENYSIKSEIKDLKNIILNFQHNSKSFDSNKKKNSYLNIFQIFLKFELIIIFN